MGSVSRRVRRHVPRLLIALLVAAVSLPGFAPIPRVRLPFAIRAGRAKPVAVAIVQGHIVLTSTGLRLAAPVPKGRGVIVIARPASR